MAAFIIGAGILLVDKVVEERKLKKRAKREQKQQQRLEDLQIAHSRQQTELAGERSYRVDDAPPSYEELYGRRRTSSEERRREESEERRQN